jgi:hypothetical protein
MAVLMKKTPFRNRFNGPKQYMHTSQLDYTVIQFENPAEKYLYIPISEIP